MNILSRLLLLFLCVSHVGICRPLDTDDTGTVARGTWEVEGGFDYARTAGAGSWALTPVAAYGVADRLQVDFGCDHLVEMGEAGEPSARSLKPSLQFKHLLWASTDARLSLGWKGNVGWPVNVRGPQARLERHGHLRVLVTRVLGATELDFNAGYDFTGAWGGGDDAWVASAGFRRPATSALSWVGEVSAVSPQSGPASGLAALGVKFETRSGWTLDALAGTGVGRDGPDLRLVFGFVRAM